MELVPKAEFSIVIRASSKAWIPELIAAAGAEVTETYIDFFTATIRNRNTRAAYARALLAVFDWCAAHGLVFAAVFYPWKRPPIALRLALHPARLEPWGSVGKSPSPS